MATRRTKTEKVVKEAEEVTELKTFEQVGEAVKGDAQVMKEHLDKQPKVSFLIPLSPGEKEGSYETVCLNGYTMQIKKGVLVSLPRQVVEILATKYKVEMEAGSEMKTNRSAKVEEALS